MEDLVEAVSAQIPDNQLREALRQAVAFMIPSEMSLARSKPIPPGRQPHTPPVAAPSTAAPSTEVATTRTAGSAGEDATEEEETPAAPRLGRTEQYQAVARKLETLMPVEGGKMKRMGELTREDLLFVAARRERQGRSLLRRAEKFRRAAELVGDGVLSDLSEDALVDVLS